MIFTEFTIFALIGALTGISAGLLGISGGVIVVPLLAMTFQNFGINGHVVMHMAVATSLAAMVFTAASSTYSHNRRGAVIWHVFWQFLPGIIIGTILGVLFASLLSTQILKYIFVIFLILIAIGMFFSFHVFARHHLPKPLGMSFVGLFIGAKSGLLGVGGGAITVPFLTWASIPMRRASGTAAACGLPIAIVGTISTIYTGWGVTQVSHYTLGYVYWPAAMMVAASSMLCVFIGSKLSLLLPTILIKRIFAFVLILAAINLL